MNGQSTRFKLSKIICTRKEVDELHSIVAHLYISSSEINIIDDYEL